MMITARSNPSRRFDGGFTLLEAMIAMLIVAIAAVAVAQMLGATSQQASASHDRTSAESLARELMEEIASRAMTDTSGAIAFGPASGMSSRSSYLVIGNFSGYTDNTSAIKMTDGTVLNLGLGLVYTRTVAVEYRNTPGGSATTSSTAPFCVVTVTVAAPLHQPTTLVRLFARTGSNT